jgi:hypothetical protein
MHTKTVSVALLVLAMSLLPTKPAQAEEDELVVGVEGMLALPNTQPCDPFSGASCNLVAWNLGAWSASGVFEYGILQDLYLGARLGYGRFWGATDGFTHEVLGVVEHGRLTFEGQMFSAQATARYNLLVGFGITPYLEGSVGFLWASYFNSELRNGGGRLVTNSIPEFGRAHLVFEVGVFADYRVLDTVTVGLGFRFGKVVDDLLLNSWLSIPLRVSYFWF